MIENESFKRLAARRKAIFGPMRTIYEAPFHPVRGEGQWLYDVTGMKVLDAYNNVAHVGHCHPRVVEAICKQASTLNTNSRYVYESIVDYGERLTSSVGRGYGCFFTCTGSEAADLAWRLASTFTGNSGVVTTAQGYHGNTTFLSSIDASSSKLNETNWRVTVPAPRNVDWESQQNIKAASARYADHFSNAAVQLAKAGYRPGAFFFDSFFASDGLYIPPAGFIDEAIARIRKAGAVIVADEVQGGLFRPGTHAWGYQRLGVQPDIVVMGKPLGNGHPIGAVVVRKEILDHFYRVDRYFNTFAGNPVSCAAGLAVLDVIEREGLQENAQVMGRKIGEGLQALAGRHAALHAVRGHGMLWGVEVVDPVTREPDVTRTKWLVNEMCRRGVLVGMTGPNRKERYVLKVRPPIVFDDEGVQILLSVLEDTLHAAAGGL